ncbi:MAG: hypothetical protein WBW85_19730 [Terriglobales bacterium]
MFCGLRGQLLAAKRAGIEARRRATHNQSHALPFYRYLRPDGAARVVDGRARLEDACPLGQPLVESVHAASLVLAANVAAVAQIRPVTTSDKL